MPDSKEIVINTTPILSLITATGSLDVLKILYHRVWVPLEVCHEVQKGGASGLGISEFTQAKFLYKQAEPVHIPPLLRNSLDIGEASVIQTALNHDIKLVAIDETVGRRYANLSGLTLTGTLGILLRAKQSGYPLKMTDAIKQMQQQGIWLSTDLIKTALRMACEDF